MVMAIFFRLYSSHYEELFDKDTGKYLNFKSKIDNIFVY